MSEPQAVEAGASLPDRISRLCPFGDPHCPCQDGDSCHYTGENPMPAPGLPDRIGAAIDAAEKFARGAIGYGAAASAAGRQVLRAAEVDRAELAYWREQFPPDDGAWRTCHLLARYGVDL